MIGKCSILPFALIPASQNNKGICVPNTGAFDWAAYWANSGLFLFFGQYSNIAGGRLNNEVTGATDWLTVAGVAGSETYQCPNDAAYIAADINVVNTSDYIWFKKHGTQRTVTTAELIGYDFTRTLINYDDTNPYAINWIAILNVGETVTDAMRDSFHLSVWWDNILNAHGNVKGNRGAGQSIWTVELDLIAQYQTAYDSFTTKPSDTVADYQDTFVRALITGGVWAKHDVIGILAQTTNGANEAFTNWIDPGNHTATAINAPLFTPLEGITTDNAGGLKYLDLNWNAAHGPNYVQNSACFWYYSRTSDPTGSHDMGSYQAPANIITISNYINGNCYINSNQVCALGAGSAQGFRCVVRTSVSTVSIYKAKVKVDFTSKNSNGISALDFFLGCADLNGGASGGSDNQFSAHGMGAALNETEENCLYDAIQAYMTSLGKQV